MENGLIFEKKLFTSNCNIAYSGNSSLNTVDLHFPTAPTSASTLWLIYVHGGAFRDPLQTSSTIQPTLPHLFNPSSAHYTTSTYAIASLNYRLSPYPSHPTHPSHPGDPSRNAKWPDHFEDVKAGIEWVLKRGKDHDTRNEYHGKNGDGKVEYILVGHSVGGTIALKVAQSPSLAFPYPVAVISLCGIYDFTALRDTHPSTRHIYNDFTTAAFGPEEDGGWQKGNTFEEDIKKDMVVVLGHSRSDQLVEWGQVEKMRNVLHRISGEGKGKVLEIGGDHKEIYEKGDEVARCIKETVRLLEGRGYFGLVTSDSPA